MEGVCAPTAVIDRRASWRHRVKRWRARENQAKRSRRGYGEPMEPPSVQACPCRTNKSTGASATLASSFTASVCSSASSSTPPMCRTIDGAPDVRLDQQVVIAAEPRLIADGGYAGPKLRGALERIGIVDDPLKRSDTAKGFELLPRRWVVERTFTWLGRCPDWPWREIRRLGQGMASTSPTSASPSAASQGIVMPD